MRSRERDFFRRNSDQAGRERMKFRVSDSGSASTGPVKCPSVGWLIYDDADKKMLAPNMGEIEDEHNIQVRNILLACLQIRRIVCLSRMNIGGFLRSVWTHTERIRNPVARGAKYEKSC